MWSECESTCNFCIVHRYGVYVLTISGALILIIIICIYRREFCGIFCRKKQQVPGQDVNNLKYPMDETSGQDSFQNPTLSPVITSYQPYPIESAPISISVQAPVVRTVQPQQKISPPPQITQMMPIPPMPPQQQLPPQMRQQVLAIKKTVNEPQPLAAVKTDAFKLPTLDDVLTPHESTGSNYYKQMFQNKRPVASISQYHLLKKKKAKKDEKEEKTVTKNKDHHHHKHHHKKEVKKKEQNLL